MSESNPYKFKYRLLASADVVGSTAFKVGQAKKNEHWAHVFRSFFDEFPAAVADAFTEVPDDLISCGKPTKPFEIWKFVGDEVLFSVPLERHEHTAIHVVAFKNALERYSQYLSKTYKVLALKGTIWGAGFPVLNVEVETKIPSSNNTVADFLGPAIDLGFRLAGFADRRKIPVSADVALFLASCLSHPKAKKEIHLIADPPQQLKGVNDGIPYPLISIDRRTGQRTAEDKLLKRDAACTLDSLVDYLGEQFDRDSGPLLHPFIESDPSTTFGKVPDDMSNARDKLRDDDPNFAYARDVNQLDPDNASTTTPLLPQATKPASKSNRVRTKTSKNSSHKRSKQSS